MENQNSSAVGRLHGVWIIAHCTAENAIDVLLDIARGDPDSRVQVQAVRAVADLTDSILIEDEIAGAEVKRTSPLAWLSWARTPTRGWFWRCWRL